LDAIVARKKGEISQYGTTYWSFAAVRTRRVELWRAELGAAGLASCPVVCCGSSTKDPQRHEADVFWAKEWSADRQSWLPLPERVTNYHRPARNGVLASAFVVKDIAAPTNLQIRRPSRWLAMKPPAWRATTVPTRGEYLVRGVEPADDGNTVRLVLTVEGPFVVWIR
jgi:hypothetical protein